MAYDIVIKNGTVIDGSGMPRYRSDVAIKDGKIVARGRIGDSAGVVIDAEGLIVAPGLIDVHTHYDPHLAWNPQGTSSCWHGVTTVVTGNCGLTLAPVRPEHRELLMGIFGTVEELSMACLNAIVPWGWEDFGGYMARMDRGLGLNVASLVGHSALRLYAMGEASLERAATSEEMERMKQAFRRAMEAGAFGWSTSLSPTHVGPDGRPVPSRMADNAEVLDLVGVLAEYNHGSIEVIPPSGVFGLTQEDRDLLEQMALVSGRPVNWLVHSHRWFAPDTWRSEQEWMRQAARRGAQLFGNTALQPGDRRVNYKRTTFFNGLETWRDIMKLPLGERKARFADPALRPTLRHAVDNPQTTTTRGQIRPPIRWEGVTVDHVKLAKNKHMEGKGVTELAAQRGVHVSDFMTDLALEEDLDTDFKSAPTLEKDEGVRGELLKSPFVMWGNSDSGAHINSDCKSGEPTYGIRHWALDKELVSLEEVIRRFTWMPASVAGIHDRGLIREGMAADIFIFSTEELQLRKHELVQDVPGGETRYVQKAEGIKHAIVNGRLTLNDDQHTGDLPGRMLRSGAYKG